MQTRSVPSLGQSLVLDLVSHSYLTVGRQSLMRQQRPDLSQISWPAECESSYSQLRGCRMMPSEQESLYATACKSSGFAMRIIPSK